MLHREKERKTQRAATMMELRQVLEETTQLEQLVHEAIATWIDERRRKRTER